MDKEKAGRNLEIILEKMHSETDLALLGEYHKLFRKKTSLFRRSWAAAWLLMYYDQKEIPRGDRDRFNNRFKAREEKQNSIRPNKRFDKQADIQSDKQGFDVEITLSEEESKRLFISIGKNRRLYPREVITFICAKTSAAREDIGSIRILDNYSFIQVRDTKADEIIEALNGVKFRGRTLTVNYAKPKISEE